MQTAKPLCAFTFRPAPCLEIPDGTKSQADKSGNHFFARIPASKPVARAYPRRNTEAAFQVMKSRPVRKIRNPRKTRRRRQNAKTAPVGSPTPPLHSGRENIFDNLENNSGDRKKMNPGTDARNPRRKTARKRSISTWKHSISCRKSLEIPSLSEPEKIARTLIPAF